MAATDHVIDSIMSFFEPEYEELLSEWKSNQFPKMSDCPSWGSCKAMNEAIHVLEKYAYGKPMTINLSSMLKSDSLYLN